jgi:arsenate reductase-like glutaredoxin family protein
MKIDFEKRDFFKDRLSELEIRKILKLTSMKPKELLRKRDKMYKELELEKENKTDTQLIKLLAKYPGLIRRPIIIKKNKVLVGKIDKKEMKKL